MKSISVNLSLDKEQSIQWILQYLRLAINNISIRNTINGGCYS